MTRIETTLDETLAERGSKYGDFFGYAALSQNIKLFMHAALRNNTRFKSLPTAQQLVVLEGLDMIAVKLARICNGDPAYEDSWLDIEGYSRITRERVCSKGDDK